MNSDFSDSAVVVADPAIISDNAFYLPQYQFVSPLPSGYYHVRLKAVTPSETYYSNTQSFFNGTAVSNIEIIDATYSYATDSVYVQALVEGVVDTGVAVFEVWNESGDWMFEANPDTVFGQAPQIVEGVFGGLAPDTSYLIKLRVTNPYESTANNPPAWVYTGVWAEDFETRTPIAVTSTTARLKGYGRGFIEPVQITLEYGLTPSLGSVASSIPDSILDTEGYVLTSDIENLQPNTYYYYQFKATGQEGNVRTGGLRQVYTGAPSIPNWNFENWDSINVEVPLGWNLRNEDFEKVDLGNDNYSLKIGGSNLAVFGYWVNNEDSLPTIHASREFIHRPDTVYLTLNYSIEPGDSAMSVVKILSSPQTIAQETLVFSGSSGGNYETLGIPMNYNGSETPDRIAVGLFPSLNNENNSPNYIEIDEVSFSNGISTYSDLQLLEWENVSYDQLKDWKYDMFLDNALGNLEYPHLATPELIDVTDTVLVLQSKLVDEHVIEAEVQSTFNLQEEPQALMVYHSFDALGTDTFETKLLLYEDGELIADCSTKRGDPTNENSSLEVGVEYLNPQINHDPDSATVIFAIRNTDGVSLSTAKIQHLSFDGLYSEPDTIGYVPDPDGVHEGGVMPVIVYPNPSNDIFKISGISGPSKLEVWDVTGKLIQRNTVMTNECVIDLSGNTRGFYLLKLIINNQELTKRLILNP